MDPVIEPVAQLYAVDTALFKKALEGLDQEALLKRPSDNSNPMIWIAGHLTYARCGVLNLLGICQQMPWEEFFGRGKPLASLEGFPDIVPIQDLWNDISARLMVRFEELTPSKLSSPSPRDFPIADKSLRGAVTFMVYHEAYHIGQMSYLRKWLGFDSLVG